MLRSVPCSWRVGLLLCVPWLGACGGSSAPFLPSSIAVEGTVLSENLVPVADSPVLIEGHDLVYTDPEGHFRVEDVSIPYTAIAFEMDSNSATVYEGLTRPDPWLTRTYYWPDPFGPKDADISGTILGGQGFPSPPGVETAFFAFPAYGRGFGEVGVDPNTGNYVGLGTCAWAGPNQTPVTLRAIQRETSAGSTVAYIASGVRSVDVYDGEFLGVQYISMLPIPTYQHTGTITAAPGMTIDSSGVGIRSATGGVLGLDFTLGSSPTFSWLSPGIDGTKAYVYATGVTSDGHVSVWQQNLSGNTSGTEIALFAPPSAVDPADGATGVDYGVKLTFTPVVLGVHTVSIQPLNLTFGLASFQIVTAADHVGIPDLRVYGLGLAPSTQYSWYMSAVGPRASVDDAAGPQGIDPPTGSRRFRASTNTRVFTSAP